MKDSILLKCKNKIEIIELATIQGFDQGAIDKLIARWVELKKVKNKKKNKSIN